MAVWVLPLLLLVIWMVDHRERSTVIYPPVRYSVELGSQCQSREYEASFAHNARTSAQARKVPSSSSQTLVDGKGCRNQTMQPYPRSAMSSTAVGVVVDDKGTSVIRSAEIVDEQHRHRLTGHLAPSTLLLGIHSRCSSWEGRS
ncbi:hypothetical protein FH972_026481 [Carpinus fangiana]|uniref:Secreted protein n=1 Tax=Carpinus fangiana TaxID=176857 RepID=A0A5N6L4G2_9ROSI|nr:hypothetical protein FH972_026481 [Carpinus fangiana]